MNDVSRQGAVYLLGFESLALYPNSLATNGLGWLNVLTERIAYDANLVWLHSQCLNSETEDPRVGLAHAYDGRLDDIVEIL